ncbi:jg19616 [Pararge aegeria aegeria]|uniref:Jg19616 protein n=1 Tax=Pararge aegeria aegeria TaxID=348720 RepID=A0A8S4S617_9NEOP|nr:jg19616 [Pararge aegeria aegeria]
MHCSFEEPRVKYDGAEISEDLLKTWVFVQSMPTIVEFSHETASKIFGGQIKYHLLLFLSKVRLKLRILEFFGMKKEEVPSARLIALEQDMAKYKPANNELSANAVEHTDRPASNRCGHCKQLVPIYDKLAEHFEKDDDVVIAKIDATANELEHTKVTSFPTIKLYLKDNQVREYNGERTLAALTKFVESDGEGAEPVPTVSEDDEDDEAAPRDEL